MRSAKKQASEPERPARNVWVLDTETKGTGANMVPLERVLRRPGSSDGVPGFGFRKVDPRDPGAPEPRQPYRFKLVDLMTRQTLAEDIDARDAVRALEDVRSIVDVTIYVWEPAEQRWRLLSFEESRLLWDYRGRVDKLGGAATPDPAP